MSRLQRQIPTPLRIGCWERNAAMKDLVGRRGVRFPSLKGEKWKRDFGCLDPLNSRNWSGSLVEVVQGYYKLLSVHLI